MNLGPSRAGPTPQMSDLLTQSGLGLLLILVHAVRPLPSARGQPPNTPVMKKLVLLVYLRFGPLSCSRRPPVQTPHRRSTRVASNSQTVPRSTAACRRAPARRRRWQRGRPVLLTFLDGNTDDPLAERAGIDQFLQIGRRKRRDAAKTEVRVTYDENTSSVLGGCTIPLPTASGPS